MQIPVDLGGSPALPLLPVYDVRDASRRSLPPRRDLDPTEETVARMGTLKYDGTTVEFADRVLAHIEVVVVQKLRRQEAFFLSWHESTGGGGRTGIWLHPAVLITFHYSSNEPTQIDRAWVEKLAVAASSAAGMFVSDEEGRPLPASYDESLT